MRNTEKPVAKGDLKKDPEASNWGNLKENQFKGKTTNNAHSTQYEQTTFHQYFIQQQHNTNIETGSTAKHLTRIKQAHPASTTPST